MVLNLQHIYLFLRRERNVCSTIINSLWTRRLNCFNSGVQLVKFLFSMLCTDFMLSVPVHTKGERRGMEWKCTCPLCLSPNQGISISSPSSLSNKIPGGECGKNCVCDSSWKLKFGGWENQNSCTRDRESFLFHLCLTSYSPHGGYAHEFWKNFLRTPYGKLPIPPRHLLTPSCSLPYIQFHSKYVFIFILQPWVSQ